MFVIANTLSNIIFISVSLIILLVLHFLSADDNLRGFSAIGIFLIGLLITLSGLSMLIGILFIFLGAILMFR